MTDNKDAVVDVDFWMNNEALASLRMQAQTGSALTVKLPCIRGGEVHELVAYATDADDNTHYDQITIDAGSGQGINPDLCPKGIPRDVWYANQEAPASAGPVVGSPFDQNRREACLRSFDEDPLCCYGRGQWTTHIADGTTYHTCEDIRCSQDLPCPQNRYCADDGYCRY